jgi:hypothetical protein
MRRALPPYLKPFYSQSMSNTSPVLVSALTGPVGDVEPEFLHDVSTDHLVGAIYALSAELWVVRDRQKRLERVLESLGAMPAGAVEDKGDTPEEAAALALEAERFAARILGELVRGKTPVSSVGGARRGKSRRQPQPPAAIPE